MHAPLPVAPAARLAMLMAREPNENETTTAVDKFLFTLNICVLLPLPTFSYSRPSAFRIHIAAAFPSLAPRRRLVNIPAARQSPVASRPFQLSAPRLRSTRFCITRLRLFAHTTQEPRPCRSPAYDFLCDSLCDSLCDVPLPLRPPRPHFRRSLDPVQTDFPKRPFLRPRRVPTSYTCSLVQTFTHIQKPRPMRLMSPPQ